MLYILYYIRPTPPQLLPPFILHSVHHCLFFPLVPLLFFAHFLYFLEVYVEDRVLLTWCQ